MFGRPVILLLLAAFGSFTGFHLLLPVVPLYVSRIGGGSAEAGLATTALLLTTVLTQIQMPRLLGRFGYRTSFVAGLLLLGLPAFFYASSESFGVLLALTLVRGVGFGVVTVVAGALIAELIPPDRLGEGIGLFGVAAGVPAVLGLPSGLWLLEFTDFARIFFVGAAAPLLGAVAAMFIRVATPEWAGRESGFFSGLARPELLRPSVLFCSSTVAFGVVATFLPLSVAGSGLGSAAAALFVVGAATAAARWRAGTLGDRYGPRRLLAPGLVLCALGMLGLGLAEGAALLLAGSLLYGLGFGALQNATMVLMVKRVSNTEYGLASTLWNFAFDAGTGLGGFAFGFVIEAAGFQTAFAIVAALLFVTIPIAALDRSGERRKA